MSVKKANQNSEDLKEEDEPHHQLLPVAIATAEAPPSFQASNLFNSSHIVQETNIAELSEFSEQHHQQPCDLLSLQAKKNSEFQTSETASNARIKRRPSPMRLMRKMMAREQITMSKSRGKIESVIRVCSACNTTKTPLWRSGPQGPKSLCNACGIRRMKARRAAVATSTIQNQAMIVENEEKSDVNRTIPYKKRHKVSNLDVDHVKLRFDDSSVGLRESSVTLHPTFPRDEKDAAILLMTLSFG